MAEGLRHRLVGVWDICVFADKRDRHLAIRVLDGTGDTLPGCQIRRRRVRDSEMGEDFRIKPLGMVGHGHIVDVSHITGLNDACEPDIAEAGNLAFFIYGDWPVAAAKKDLWLNSDRPQLLDGVLRRLRFHFASCGNVWE